MLRRFLVLLSLVLTVRAEPRIEQNVIRLDTPFTFVGETDRLTAESDAASRQLAAFLAAKPALTRLRVEGHVADNRDASAQSLSERRALAVARTLVAHGVDCPRLLAVGFGDTKPIVAPRASPENNRIEVHVAALRGRSLGGLPEDGGGHSAGPVCEE